MTFAPRPFRPSWLASGPHSQTLVARAFRSAEGPHYRRERLDTPDGDFLDIDWTPDPGAGAPMVLVLHGLEGSASRRYVRNVCRELLGRGVWPVALNFRGCSGTPNRRPRFYHSGATDDPRFVLRTLKARYPDRRLGAFGFSLGGNILLKLLGEDAESGDERVEAAVAMSVPYDLAAGSRLLERSRMGAFYSAYFLRSLRRKVRAKESVLRGLLDVDAIYEAKTIWAFDDLATAPLHGFESAAAYYESCSSARFLDRVAVPTLLLHASDDPFLPAESVPRAACADNTHLQLALSPRGGHVGFLAGGPLRPSFWGDEEGARFLAETLRGQPVG